MSQAKSGDKVAVHYTGTLADGSVFDSSIGGEPLHFVIGDEQVIPGFEQAVVGLTPGESRKVNIESDEAYGPYDPEMAIVVGREHFPADMPLEVGQGLRLKQSDGQAFDVVVTSLTEEKVSLDGNHPLAGKDLTFDIQLVEIL